VFFCFLREMYAWRKQEATKELHNGGNTVVCVTSKIPPVSIVFKFC
jgi:hypothetical protein